MHGQCRSETRKGHVWKARSLFRDEEAAGSNPATPTRKHQVTRYRCPLGTLRLSRCPILGARREPILYEGLIPFARSTVPAQVRACLGPHEDPLGD
jgi:hypothetical protein